MWGGSFIAGNGVRWKGHSRTEEEKVEEEVGGEEGRDGSNGVFHIALLLRLEGNRTFRIILEKRVRRMPSASMYSLLVCC